jgi:diaminopimelate epimerase
MLSSIFSKKINFMKMSGAGNDFIIIDNRNNLITQDINLLAKKLCSRRYSIGADGLILVENSKKANFRSKFYNADGTEFNLCGNGGRCVARFAFINVIASKRMSIETNAGCLSAEILSNSVKLQIPLPINIEMNKIIEVDEKKIKGHLIKIGDPHFIAFAKNLNEMPFEAIARKMRHSKSFGSEGSNIDLIMLKRENRIIIRTFERGVEQETPACGSGCVSAAIALYYLKYPYLTYIFETKSGFPLTVQLITENDTISKIMLEGDARVIYKGEAYPEAWEY